MCWVCRSSRRGLQGCPTLWRSYVVVGGEEVERYESGLEPVKPNGMQTQQRILTQKKNQQRSKEWSIFTVLLSSPVAGCLLKRGVVCQYCLWPRTGDLPSALRYTCTRVPVQNCGAQGSVYSNCSCLGMHVSRGFEEGGTGQHQFTASSPPLSTCPPPCCESLLRTERGLEQVRVHNSTNTVANAVSARR